MAYRATAKKCPIRIYGFGLRLKKREWKIVTSVMGHHL
jgi:hypothetical protein